MSPFLPDLINAVFAIDSTGAAWAGAIPFPSELYLEGAAPGEGHVTLLLENNDSPRQEVHRDQVTITRVKGDVDIDSNNDNDFDPPSRSLDEDRIEDSDTRPGKFIDVNDNDDDGDGVPDYADGYNFDGVAGSE